MALKCVTCGLLFRNRNELDWHVREAHLERRLPPAKDQPGAIGSLSPIPRRPARPSPAPPWAGASSGLCC